MKTPSAACGVSSPEGGFSFAKCFLSAKAAVLRSAKKLSLSGELALRSND